MLTVKFLRLPESYGSGGEAGRPVSSIDGAADAADATAATAEAAQEDAAQEDASQAASDAWAQKAYISPLWMFSLGALVLSVNP